MNLTITVAADGSGQFATVQEAVNAAPDNSRERVTIRIKNGVYREKLTVPKQKPNLAFIGESKEGTVLTFNDNANTKGPDGNPLGTSKSASAFIYGTYFTAENLTFRNDSGQGTGQALAIYVQGDRASFRQVRFLGFQDTVYTGEGRQYYEDCYIEGDVDFIFGPATAVFNRCELHSKRSGGYLTAASTPQEKKFGYVFVDCIVTGDEGVKDVWLGRPWRPYASVVFVRTRMDGMIAPGGWHNWNKADNEETARYAEFGSTGAGANPSARVGWSKQLTAQEADAYTPGSVLAGTDGWNPARREAEAGRQP